MPQSELEFSRDYDLPPAIVWDALVDEVLVEGWLAVARIQPRLGGSYWLDWQTGTSLAATNGTIAVFDAPHRLVVETDNVGRLDFSLAARPGGTRGTGTLLGLRIVVDIDRRLLGSTRAYWLSNFDQLDDLLVGHPVDWSTWQRDRGEAWAGYLRAASGSD